MKRRTWNSEYFYGHKISNYGLENGYVDYRSLASAFDMVLNNSIVTETWGNALEWETINGSEISYYDSSNDRYVEYDEIENWDDIYETYAEIFQYYIISELGYRILSELTDEIVFYNDKLDMYVWGVTHWGTSWDYVLTDIKIVLGEE